MSRPVSCSAVYGFRPSIGWVVLRWKNSGTISTSPPNETATTINTIIRKLLVSIFSWPVTARFAMAFSPRRSGVGHHRRHRHFDRPARGHRLDHVPRHDQHAGEVQQAAGQADDVEGKGRLHALDEAVHQRAVGIEIG